MLDPIFHSPEEIKKQRERFFKIMRRHIRVEDGQLSDFDMADAVYRRHLAFRGVALIDPNE